MDSEEKLLKEIKQEPDNINKYWALGQFYFRTKNKKKLKLFLDAITGRFYFVAEFFYMRAQLFIEERAWLKAELDLKRCIELKQDSPIFYDTLGVVFQRLEQYEQAIAAHKKAITLEPNHPGFLFNYAVANDKAGKTNIAKHCYVEIINRFQNEANARLNLAIIFKREGNFNQAKKLLSDILVTSPRFFPAIMELGSVAKQEEDISQAKIWYMEAKKINPNHPEIDFILDSLSGVTTEKPPSSYVAQLFDGFADGFDETLLTKLEYTVPQQIFSMVAPYLAPEMAWLDLGAGTGLLAKHVKPYVSHSVAVDLSSKMLAKAESQKLYNSYICADLVEAMVSMGDEQYDLVSASDVFVYIGNLKDVFAQTFRVLKKDGIFAFTTEENVDKDVEYSIKDTMRYGHAKAYVEKLSQGLGFSILECQKATLRTNRGKPVAGYLYLLKKS